VLTDARFLGRSRDGLYEPVLADIEREAVADLLQYLENVRLSVLWDAWLPRSDQIGLTPALEGGSRLLLRRAPPGLEHSRILGQHRPPAERESYFRRDNRARYGFPQTPFSPPSRTSPTAACADSSATDVL